MLSKGLKLFYADVIDTDTKQKYYFYFVDKDYDSAFDSFIKEMNDTFYVYDYYFYEVEDKEEIEGFVEWHENIEIGIYELQYQGVQL